LRGGCGEFARANKARLRGRADLRLGHFLELIAPDSAGLENGCLRRVSVNQSELPPVAQRDDFAQPQFSLQARRTNAHSRKLANHKACVALWVAWYNFVRVNTSVRMTPCMAAGITSTIWTMRDLLASQI
jgi:hypothetical protein